MTHCTNGSTDTVGQKREKYEKYTHVELIEIYNYLSDKTYPEHITDKGMKSIFQKACKNFEIVHSELRHKCKRKDGSTMMVSFWPG